MSRGDLQEMEVGTKQSRTAVNANAKPAGSADADASGVSTPGQTGNWEDLGGPTPDNYKNDDDSAKIKDPAATLKTVKDAVNAKAKAAEAMKSGDNAKMSYEETELEDDEVISEEEVTEEETVEESEEVVEADSIAAMRERAAKRRKQRYGASDTSRGGRDDFRPYTKADYERGEANDPRKKDQKEEFEAEETFDIEEDLQALHQVNEEEGLSEEYQEKSKIVFEAALRSKVAQIKEALDEEYEVQFEQKVLESVEEIKSELQERVDAYLEYVADEWIAQNELAVQAGLKEELTESFLSGMKNLFEEHYVQIPEEKYDVLESMVDKLDEMETKLNEQIERNVALNNRLSESVADRIFDEISEGLAVTQKEKLASLSESVEFESETQYREKLETLKESYFPKKTVSEEARVETLSEGVDVATEFHSDVMNSYLKTLSTVAKN